MTAGVQFRGNEQGAPHKKYKFNSFIRILNTAMPIDFDLEKRLRAMYTTLKLAKKPTKEDYKIHLRLVLLGLGVIGAIGFLIQFVSSLIAFSGSGGA